MTDATARLDLLNLATRVRRSLYALAVFTGINSAAILWLALR